MPSKGGRSTEATRPAATPAVVSGPPVERSPEQWTALGYTGAALAQPLRRGLEVERLAVLAAREDQLGPDEAEELYRFRIRRVLARLRQLSRARTRADEEAIRDALDDLDGRVDELRALEDMRQASGLAAGYPLDLEERQRAVDQLLELARRRAPGLVAGDGEPAQTFGEVRLPAVAFATSDQDVPVYLIAPSSIPSDALARNVEAVAGQGANLRLVHDPSEIQRDGDMPPLAINWGGTDSLPAGLVALNRPEAVRIASDQVESVRRLGELAPRTVLRPDDIPLLGGERVVAKRRHGARGSGKAVIASDAAWSERARHDLFQQFVADRDEFRVSCLNGRVVSAYRKVAPLGASPEDLRPEWRHEQVQVLPAAVVSVAREGARRIGLDYAGVDVLVDRQTGRAYCLEANAAPGMSEQTLRSLYAHLQQTVRGRMRRAS